MGRAAPAKKEEEIRAKLLAFVLPFAFAATNALADVTIFSSATPPVRRSKAAQPPLSARLRRQLCSTVTGRS